MLYNEIVKLAEEYFGEENVDLQEDSLVIKVGDISMSTEENLKYTNRELWVKINLSTCNFKLTKSKYTLEECQSKYVHSHSTSSEALGGFVSPCIGEGPLKDTIKLLQNNKDNLEIWIIYFSEIIQFLQTENTKTGCFIKIKDLGTNLKFWMNDKRGFILDDKIKDAIERTVREILQNNLIKYKLIHSEDKIDLQVNNSLRTLLEIADRYTKNLLGVNPQDESLLKYQNDFSLVYIRNNDFNKIYVLPSKDTTISYKAINIRFKGKEIKPTIAESTDYFMLPLITIVEYIHTKTVQELYNIIYPRRKVLYV